MNNLITQGENYLTVGELPPHISYEEFQKMLIACEHNIKYAKTIIANKKWQTNRVLIILMWATGGRIGDIVQIKKKQILFYEKMLSLFIQKRKNNNWIKIPLDPETLMDLNNYINEFKLNDEDKLFDFNRCTAWRFIKKLGFVCGINGLHPHKFRHGIAIHLLKQNVSPITVAARLGHVNPHVTMKTYMKLTPELQRDLLKGVQIR